MELERMADLRSQLQKLGAQVIGPGKGRVSVIVARGEIEIISEDELVIAAAEIPNGMSDYDKAIIMALTDRPVSAERLARQSQHRNNSYFRERLAALVEQGRIQRTRRGYRLPDS